jgi:hypothetical protein
MVFPLLGEKNSIKLNTYDDPSIASRSRSLAIPVYSNPQNLRHRFRR